jgi:hypothetical protein
MRRLVDDDFLVVLIERGDPHPAGEHHVGLSRGVADLPDALPGRELLEFDLCGQDRRLFVVQ